MEKAFDSKQFLGQTMDVVIDRKLDSKHPKWDFTYAINYGYIPEVFSADGDELDAYVLGIDKPIEKFSGVCIAVIERLDDNEDKLIIVPEGVVFSEEEIEKAVKFQEKWFKHRLIMGERVMKRRIILSGGGSDIYKILDGLVDYNIYNGKVGYIAIAMEPKEDFSNRISGFDEIAEYIMKLGATSVELILSDNLSDVGGCDSLILCGGRTEHLLNVLKENNFYEIVVNNNQIKNLVGTSAGAIALSKKGVVPRRDKEVLLDGFGFCDCKIVVHSNDKLVEKYKEYINLKEYENKEV